MNSIILHLVFIILGVLILYTLRNIKSLYIVHVLISFLSLFFSINALVTKKFLIQTQIDVIQIIPDLFISFSLDGLGIIFLITSNALWLMTAIYSHKYLELNKYKNKAKFYIFFTLSMFATNAIIYSSNLLTTFIFYEILTISTYPLVTFKGDDDSISSGKKYLYYLLGTSIIFLLPAIIIIYSIAGTLDYKIGGILTSYNNPLMINILIILLIFGVAKSAIMPFHKWLPFAMIAPTPVSALLHAVAVVKSGVFIIIKVVLYIFGPLILQESGANIIIILFASITILLSSITAIKQDSIKLRLAYSTIGQLSYIVLAIAILAPYSILAATLHLIFHAIGKIILFLTAGIITTGIGIKKVSEMNGLASKFPYTIFLMSLGALIMIGLPPTIGFISKWYLIIGIIESTKIYLLAVIVISTLLNASYYLPMIYKPYFKSFEAKYNESNSEDMCLVAPVIIIGLAAIILFFNTDLIIMFIQEYIIKL